MSAMSLGQVRTLRRCPIGGTSSLLASHSNCCRQRCAAVTPRAAPSKTHYDLLGVTQRASRREVKEAFRRLALQWHPDKRPGSERVFQELKTAHDTLMDGASREAYDRCLQQSAAPPAPAPHVVYNWSGCGGSRGRRPGGSSGSARKAVRVKYSGNGAAPRSYAHGTAMPMQSTPPIAPHGDDWDALFPPQQRQQPQRAAAPGCPPAHGSASQATASAASSAPRSAPSQGPAWPWAAGATAASGADGSAARPTHGTARPRYERRPAAAPRSGWTGRTVANAAPSPPPLTAAQRWHAVHGDAWAAAAVNYASAPAAAAPANAPQPTPSRPPQAAAAVPSAAPAGARVTGGGGETGSCGVGDSAAVLGVSQAVADAARLLWSR